MKPTGKAKRALDAAMTAILLLLMAFGLVGEAAHEWLGVGLLVLLVLHHVLNRKWLCAIAKGRYTPLRVAQSALALGVLVCTLGSMGSGVMLSRHVFAFLPKRGGSALFARLHLLFAYWGFVFMGLHLGLHWSAILAAAQKRCKPSKPRALVLRLAAYLFAAYGCVCFWRRDVGLYLLQKSHFVFYDFSEPVYGFLFDYLAIFSLFVLLGFCAAKALRKLGQKRRQA